MFGEGLGWGPVAESFAGSTVEGCGDGVAESFFATLETELLDRTSFANRNQARSAIFDYIEGFYNPHRRHSTIGYHSPTDYERSTTTTPTTLPIP